MKSPKHNANVASPNALHKAMFVICAEDISRL